MRMCLSKRSEEKLARAIKTINRHRPAFIYSCVARTGFIPGRSNMAVNKSSIKEKFMSNFAGLAFSRRSIRKFKDQDIPMEEIQELIRIATSAPSGCNSQCWRFVAVKDKAVISRMEEVVFKKVSDILSIAKESLTNEYLTSKRKMTGFFAKAPVVVAVFMTSLDYYDPILINALKQHGYNDMEIMNLFANPDLLSIGAAVQNLLLAVHEKGYGACWMNEPAIAGEEINEILGVPKSNKFISLIPIGVPAYTPREKKLKSLDEVFSIV